MRLQAKSTNDNSDHNLKKILGMAKIKLEREEICSGFGSVIVTHHISSTDAQQGIEQLSVDACGQRLVA